MLGKMLRHYRIDAKIGVGGMGVVYKGWDTHLDRPVAIKVLPPEAVADPERKRRFVQEAKSASALNHPNIVTVYDVDNVDGVDFIAMEYIDGQTLDHRIGSRGIRLHLALKYAVQVADALSRAHGAGIVHRDVKPANVMVDKHEQVKVLDFGLAKLTEKGGAGEFESTVTEGPHTERGAIVGTVSYMSPEQAEGKLVDARTDIFSFGSLLYEMLTGGRAFQGETKLATLSAILSKNLEPVTAKAPGTPPELERIVTRCLRKDPDRRFQQMAEVKLALEDLKESSEVTAPVERKAARPVWVAAAAAMVLATGAGFLWWRGRVPQPSEPGFTAQRPAMRFSAITNFAGVEGQPAFSPDGRSVAFVSDRGGQYDIFVSLVSGGSLIRVTSDSNVEARPRWSPDGSKLIYARLNESGLWDTWVVPALGGIARQLVNNAADPSWSPDGRSIAYANLTTGGIWMCDAAGREPRVLTNPEARLSHRQPVFSRDGRKLAFVRRTGTGGPYGQLAVVEVGASQSHALTDQDAFVGSPAWSHDGKFIYFASGRGGAINVWKVNALGGPPEQITVGQGDDADLDVSADGRRMVFASYRVNINLEEVVLNETGEPARRWLTADAAHGEVAPVWSRDGKHIAYFTNRMGAESEAVWMMNADGSQPMPVVQDERVNSYPKWSADSRSLTYSSRSSGGGAIELRRILLSSGATQKIPFTVADHYGDVSPQEQFLYRDLNGSVRTFDPKTNQVQTLKDIQGSYLRWRRDGRGFAAMVNPRERNDVAAGVWIYDLGGQKRQAFRGWAAFYTWSGPDELLILEGKPDLKATLWRVRLDGSPKVSAGSIRLIYSYWHNVLITRFDAHPDGKRIVNEALELHQADVSMIENIR